MYVWCCSSRTSRSWWITHFTQHHRRGCNSTKPWNFLHDKTLSDFCTNASLVCSHLQYAIGAWGSVPKTALNHLNVLHNKLIRAINFAFYRSHVTPLYHHSNLLKTNDSYHLEIAKLMHGLHNGKLPQTFDDRFVPVTSVHTYLTRNATHGW